MKRRPWVQHTSTGNQDDRLEEKPQDIRSTARYAATDPEARLESPHHHENRRRNPVTAAIRNHQNNLTWAARDQEFSGSPTTENLR